MTALLSIFAVDGFRVFVAVVIVVAVATIAGVLIASTADVDAMADPAPRLGETPPALERAQTTPMPDRTGWDVQ